MSRIIVARHDNGEESLSTGYDRPMGFFFVDEYDEDGEYVAGIGLLGDGPCESPGDVSAYLSAHGIPAITCSAIAQLLSEHVYLDYPASNVVIDLTKENA